MKILHTITSLDKGGAENHLSILSSKQSLKKNNVKIFISKNSFYWLKYLKKHKIEVIKSKKFNEKNIIYKLIKLLSDIYTLKKIIEKFRPEILHAHLPYMELVSFCCIYLSEHKPKFIISKHVDNVFFKGSEGQKKTVLGSFFARIIANKSFKIIAISKAVKKFLSSSNVGLDPDKIKVIYYGIDNLNLLSNKKKKFKSPYKKKNRNEIILGCIARLVPQKSIDNIIRSIYELKNKNVKLFIVGKGPLKNKLISLAKKLKIENQIYWIEFVDDIKNFYKSIDIFVLTSHYEGLGLVFLEAMLSKKPIICSNLSAMPEIIKNKYNGILVKPNRPILLSESIKLLYNYNLRKKLSSNGYIFVKKYFLVNKMYFETLNIYNKKK